MSAFSNANIDFNRVMIFHTDRGLEFCNKHIDDFILKYGIIRSLSHKGTPYDNAVAESTYKIIKTEFVKQASDCVNVSSQFGLKKVMPNLMPPTQIKSHAVVLSSQRLYNCGLSANPLSIQSGSW